MNPELLQAKRRVRAVVLDRPGVHAVGLRQAQSAVVVYTEPAGLGEDLLAEARAAAQPFSVVVVSEEPPELLAAEHDGEPTDC